MTDALSQFVWLARRSVLRTVRQPAAIIPALAFPLIFLALITGGAAAASEIEGFPADSYLDFALAGVMVQGALLGGVNAGADFAMDIESGFIRRLSMTPLRRPVLLIGHLAGSMAVALVQGVIFLLAGAIFGVDYRTGPLGLAVLVLLTMLVALAFSAVGSIMAIRTRSSEAVQSTFPLFFIILSFSSFFFPRELIPTDWFRAVANVNPASYMIEAGRSLVISGWDAGVILTGFAAVAGVAAAGVIVSTRGLRTLMART